jgi:hypothetical protein
MKRLAAIAIAASAALVAADVAGSPASAQVSSESHSQPLTRLGHQSIEMRGGAAVRRLELRLPTGWRTASVRLRLRWNASDTITRRSTLEVRADDRALAATALEPGDGGVDVSVPSRLVRDGLATIELRTRLRTNDSKCPAPDDPGAFVTIKGDSAIDLVGTRDLSSPLLADLPEALAERAGGDVAPLTVRLARRPTPDEVRAAGIAAGWIARAAGEPGIQVRVASPGEPSIPNWPELVVDEGEKSSLSVRRRPDGGLTATVRGGRDGLARAAWALAPEFAATLSGSTTEALPEIDVPDERELPDRLPIGPRKLDADAADEFTLNVPPWIELERAARLELRLAYDAPSGGQTTVAVNGAQLGSEEAPEERQSRRKLTLAIAGEGPPSRTRELLAGENIVSLQIRPGEGGEAPCPANSVQLLPGSTLKVRADEREPTADLGLWPFPLDAQPDWDDAAVVLPSRPSRSELAAVIGALAAAARVSDYPSLASVGYGEMRNAPRDDHVLLLVRPGRVPGWARKALGRRPVTGTLAALRVDDRVVVLAVGRRALKPLTGAYAIGNLRGRAIVVNARGKMRLAAGPAERPAAVERRNFPWQAPLAVLILGVAVLAGMGSWSAIRRIRRLPPTEGA